MNKALQSALSNFTSQGNELKIGNRSLSEIAEEFGTPIYIYSKDIIKAKSQALKRVFPKKIKVYYAIKANPNLEILKIMNNLYDGVDVSSLGEIKQAIKSGIAAKKISFAGPGKTLEELDYAIDRQIGSLSIESRQEYLLVKKLCLEKQKTINIMVRVNPEFEISQSGLKMGGGPKQFGIDSRLVPDLIKEINKDKYLIYRGIHIYAGSQNLNVNELLSAYEKILEYGVWLFSTTGIPIKTINLGGGFGIPYSSHEESLDMHSVGRGIRRLVKEYEEKLQQTELVTEFGRYLVGESGVYLAKILYRKESMGKVFLIMNGGMHHHLAASGNFGQSLVRRPMPITVANRQGKTTEKVYVVGPLCTPLDSFGYVDIPHADEGDLIAVLNSGAYGYSASPLQFLSHEPPKEIVV